LRQIFLARHCTARIRPFRANHQQALQHHPHVSPCSIKYCVLYGTNKAAGPKYVIHTYTQAKQSLPAIYWGPPKPQLSNCLEAKQRFAFELFHAGFLPLFWSLQSGNIEFKWLSLFKER
jgi:hypothetical protein